MGSGLDMVGCAGKVKLSSSSLVSFSASTSSGHRTMSIEAMNRVLPSICDYAYNCFPVPGCDGLLEEEEGGDSEWARVGCESR